MATDEDRRNILLERMMQRAEERNAVLEQRRAEWTRHGGQSELENSPRFMAQIVDDTDRLKAYLDVEAMREMDPSQQVRLWEWK